MPIYSSREKIHPGSALFDCGRLLIFEDKSTLDIYSIVDVSFMIFFILYSDFLNIIFQKLFSDISFCLHLREVISFLFTFERSGRLFHGGRLLIFTNFPGRMLIPYWTLINLKYFSNLEVYSTLPIY